VSIYPESVGKVIEVTVVMLLNMPLKLVSIGMNPVNWMDVMSIIDVSTKYRNSVTVNTLNVDEVSLLNRPLKPTNAKV
jgi:hypothetical protein